MKNTRHPELKKGEVFIMNVNMNTAYNTQGVHENCLDEKKNHFESCGYTTKRLGTVAYNTNREIISGDVADMRPVFAQIKEVEKNGIFKIVDGELVKTGK